MASRGDRAALRPSVRPPGKSLVYLKEGLASLQEAVQHLVALLRQPVAGHGGHAPDENGGEDHVPFGGERRQGADDDAEEHLLQNEHLLIRDVVK